MVLRPAPAKLLVQAWRKPCWDSKPGECNRIPLHPLSRPRPRTQSTNRPPIMPPSLNSPTLTPPLCCSEQLLAALAHVPSCTGASLLQKPSHLPRCHNALYRTFPAVHWHSGYEASTQNYEDCTIREVHSLCQRKQNTLNMSFILAACEIMTCRYYTCAHPGLFKSLSASRRLFAMPALSIYSEYFICSLSDQWVI